jgi:hypothetical protein
MNKGHNQNKRKRRYENCLAWRLENSKSHVMTSNI